MTITRVNPFGWDYKAPVTHEQLNELDDNAARAVDGVQGGQYAPTTRIDIEGEGFGGRVSGEARVVGPDGGIVVDADSEGITYRDGALPKLSPAYEQTLAQPIVVVFNGDLALAGVEPQFRYAPQFGLYQRLMDYAPPVVWLALTRLPRVGTLKSVKVYVTGRSIAMLPHGNFADLVLPTVQILAAAPNGLSAALTQEETDPSPNLAAYETEHAIEISNRSLPFDSRTYMVVKVTGEDGAGAAAGNFAIRGLEITCETNSIQP